MPNLSKQKALSWSSDAPHPTPYLLGLPTSIFSKLIERVIVQEMLNYLRSNNLISKQQHGFISKRSTVTNMLESLNDWSIAVENGKSQTVAYIDFAKAFDSVCHAKLLVS